MFNFFSKKSPLLSELIPYGFVDIHNHVLPGIDDGAKDVNESQNLIREIESLGIKKIICTPHTYPGLYNNTKDSIDSSFKLLSKFNNFDIKINYASEYMIDSSLVKKAKNKDLLTLKENFVLVEMSFVSAPNMLYEILFDLITNGYCPVLAHPERYRFLFGNFKEYLKLKKIGCKFQLNLLSATKFYGNDVNKISNKLLNENLIDFVGTDIHSMNHINFIKGFMNKNSSEGINFRINLKKINELEKSIDRTISTFN